MRAVLQRVSRARVTVEERVVGEIAAGLMVLLGVGIADTRPRPRRWPTKLRKLRIFEDDAGKMNRSLLDVKGARWSFRNLHFTEMRAGSGARVLLRRRAQNRQKVLYEEFCSALRELGVQVRDGNFSGDDVGGIGERRPGDDLAGFREDVLTV